MFYERPFFSYYKSYAPLEANSWRFVYPFPSLWKCPEDLSNDLGKNSVINFDPSCTRLVHGLPKCHTTKTGKEREPFLGIPNSGSEQLYLDWFVAEIFGRGRVLLRMRSSVCVGLLDLFVILIRSFVVFPPFALFRFKKDLWLSPSRFKDYNYKNEDYSWEVLKLPGSGIVDSKTADARSWRMPSIPLPSPNYSTG